VIVGVSEGQEEIRMDEPMVIDPRTLQPVTSFSDCHLIPRCFEVSNKKVPLDGPFDHKIGENCDHHLRTAFDFLIAGSLKGNLAFAGGSQKMNGSLVIASEQLSLGIPRKMLKDAAQQGKLEPFCRKALGMNDDGKVYVTGFVTPAVDHLNASLSMVNSAVLVLHYLKRREIYGPEFDRVRTLLKKAVEGTINNSAFEEVKELTPGYTMVYFPPDKINELPPNSPLEIRKVYDPNLDVQDGVLDDFPNNCVVEEGDSLLVRLPYGKALRGVVRFPLAKAATGPAAPPTP
jgi:hypothetical protein